MVEKSSSSLPTSRRDTSNVPPPRSKTRMSSSSLPFSRPYASAAAVGSLTMRRTFRLAIWPASFVAWRSASLKYAGTVMTASVTGSPRYSSASRLSLPSTRAEISCAEYFLSSISTDQSVPMWRLTELIVRSTFVTVCRLATSPTRTSPVLENATTEGVVRAPSAFAMTVGSPPSRTETTELVVPRSMPTARAMGSSLPSGSRGARGCRAVLSQPGSSLRASEHSRKFGRAKLSLTGSTLIEGRLFRLWPSASDLQGRGGPRGRAVVSEASNSVDLPNQEGWTAMAPIVVDRMTVEEARARREEIIRRAGGDESRLRERAEAYLLSADELVLFNELESLDFLLAG